MGPKIDGRALLQEVRAHCESTGCFPRNNGRHPKRSDSRQRLADLRCGRNGPQQSGTQQGKAELWHAVERGNETAVIGLLAKGHDPEERFSGWTPLMKASEESLVEIMKLILEKGVDVNATNNKGRSALSFACAPSHGLKNKWAQSIKLLLENKADISQTDDHALTAKARAKQEKKLEAVAVIQEWEDQRPESARGRSPSRPTMTAAHAVEGNAASR